MDERRRKGRKIEIRMLGKYKKVEKTEKKLEDKYVQNFKKN